MRHHPTLYALLMACSLVAMLFTACTPTPEDVAKSDLLPPIYPDYTDVTIPSNIAPLNFLVRSDHCEAVQVEARHREAGEETAITLLNKGNEANYATKKW